MSWKLETAVGGFTLGDSTNPPCRWRLSSIDKLTGDDDLCGNDSEITVKLAMCLVQRRNGLASCLKQPQNNRNTQLCFQSTFRF